MDTNHLFQAFVEIQDSVMHCHFQFIHTTTGGRYFVKAIAWDGSTAAFEMKKNAAGHWQLVHPVPQSIVPYERTLHQIIKQQRKSRPSIASEVPLK